MANTLGDKAIWLLVALVHSKQGIAVAGQPQVAALALVELAVFVVALVELGTRPQAVAPTLIER